MPGEKWTKSAHLGNWEEGGDRFVLGEVEWILSISAPENYHARLQIYELRYTRFDYKPSYSSFASFSFRSEYCYFGLSLTDRINS